MLAVHALMEECVRPAHKKLRIARGRKAQMRRARNIRRGGRVVEGTGLENRQAGDRLVGSNPTPSAN